MRFFDIQESGHISLHPNMTNQPLINNRLFKRRALQCLMLSGLFAFLTGCSLLPPDPPANQNNICSIFREQPQWYDYAKASEQTWGSPIATQMAFIHSESGFRSNIRPPRRKLLGFIPWSRSSSAYGYAQAQNPVWGEYMKDVGNPLARRTHMKYATDFIGWYNQRTQNRLNITLDNPTHLYLAYHEGQTGYRLASYRQKPRVIDTARQVGERSRLFSSQLSQCEQEFKCRRFYQIGPLCKK
ncbi:MULTISPECIES: hypothetical protein [unclassified Methylophaga]|jgi:hypothetical protein|uniref:transglycosylase SLT domain-containing protein n=2 Tax=unclassified Methylophaga TaxID=2629249 RepID=UPI0025E55253|nr:MULTISPECIES: hypothetical protein [unclassified Methylophaga]|tara:strand:- start:6757 stop:7482 length:726 start_codon:yes stop_codon:yes gene_type:complete